MPAVSCTADPCDPVSNTSAETLSGIHCQIRASGYRLECNAAVFWDTASDVSVDKSTDSY